MSGYTNRVYVVTYLRANSVGWPVDVGDDPSFVASARYQREGGVLSWGVCRQDVRNKLEPKDLVIFFAADRFADRKSSRYFFVGFATVDKKVFQAEIWQNPELETYRRYQNLLIRPDGDGVKHCEPEADRLYWHKDWLWRIIDVKGHGKQELATIQDSDFVQPDSTINGRQVQFAPNYVLFRPEGYETCVLDNPPVVAEAQKSGCPEIWRQDIVVRDVWTQILSRAPRQSLRTSNKQQPHRHIHIPDQNIDDWLDRLHSVCSRHGLKPR